jgi:hypothetical protein
MTLNFGVLVSLAFVGVTVLPQIGGAESTEEKAAQCKSVGDAAYVFMARRQSGTPISEVLILTESEPYIGMRDLGVLLIEEAYTRSVVSGFEGIRVAQDFSNEMELRCWKARSQ